MSDLSISNKNYTSQSQDINAPQERMIPVTLTEALTQEQLQALQLNKPSDTLMTMPMQEIDMSELVALPTPGAAMMQMIVDSSAESKKINRMLAYEQGMLTVDSIKAEAQEIRENAALQLALGITSGVLTMASGLAGGLIATNKVPFLGDVMSKLDSTQLASISQSVQNLMGGAGKIVDSGASYANSVSQAVQKDLQADAEKARIEREALNSYIQAFSELISKALSTMDSIQQNTNQARTKIMG